jgi:hypothetical protein
MGAEVRGTTRTGCLPVKVVLTAARIARAIILAWGSCSLGRSNELISWRVDIV